MVEGGDGVEVPPPLCSAYEECKTAGAVDPFACANESIDSVDAGCTLDVQPEEGMCKPADAPLSRTAGDLCVWSIVGGGDVGAYLVGLRGVSSGMVGDVATECMVDLVVVEQRDGAATSASFLIWGQVPPLTDTLYHVTITPVVVEMCPTDGSGLSCTFVGTD
jgi:hypothetical protein